jgi:hypothetical protein
VFPVPFEALPAGHDLDLDGIGAALGVLAVHQGGCGSVISRAEWAVQKVESGIRSRADQAGNRFKTFGDKTCEQMAELSAGFQGMTEAAKRGNEFLKEKTRNMEESGNRVDATMDKIASRQAARKAKREAQRNAQDQANGSEHGTFDTRHQTERKPDGSLVTHQSLVATSAKNLKRDAEVVLDDATAKANANMARAKEAAANSPRQKAIDATPDVPPMTPKAGRRRPRQP